MLDFKIGKAYRFQTYAPALIGKGYDGATALAVLGFETANNFGVDLLARHKQIYPYLPTGTVNDPTAYTYLLVRLPDSSETTILGLPWIREESVEEVDSQTIAVKVYGCSSSDTQRIRDALVVAGFNQLEISRLEKSPQP